MSGTVTTSPAAIYSTGAFSDAEKADVRRFCGYPPYGIGPSGFQGWRFFQAYGELEYKLNNMAPAEFQNVRYLLAQLYTLESAIWGAAATLGTDIAAVWTRNKTEVDDREALFTLQRKRLAQVCGAPPGPDLKGGSGFDVVI